MNRYIVYVHDAGHILVHIIIESISYCLLTTVYPYHHMTDVLVRIQLMFFDSHAQ